MEVLKRRPVGVRRLAFLALALVALATGTCSVDWWFAPFGPEWLGLVRAGFDVSAAMADKLGASKADVIKVERYVHGGGERVFVLADSDRGRGLFVLDGRTMQQVAWFGSSPELWDLMFQDADGSVIVGATRVLTGLTTSSVQGTSRISEPPEIHGYCVLDGGSYNFVSPAGAGIERLLASGMASAASTIGNTPYFSSGYFGSIPDLQVLSTDVATGIFLALTEYNGSSTKLRVFHFPSYSILAGSPYLENGILFATAYPAESDQGAWLTSDGLITMVERDGLRSLERYPYDNSDQPVDAYRLRDTEDQRYFFDPDGKHWYAFDRWQGRLYLLDTWWSK